MSAAKPHPHAHAHPSAHAHTTTHAQPVRPHAHAHGQPHPHPHAHAPQHAHAHIKRHHAKHGAGHEAFIAAAAHAAKQSEHLSGVPASITIAQAVLESGWGLHHIGKANNYFGVKAHHVAGKVDDGPLAKGHVRVQTHEHVGGKDVKVAADFRAYKSMTESFADHGLFLKNNRRYHQHLEHYKKTGDVKAFAEGLQKAGYATDPHYAKLLVSIIDKHKLHKYDHVKGPEKAPLP